MSAASTVAPSTPSGSLPGFVARFLPRSLDTRDRRLLLVLLGLVILLFVLLAVVTPSDDANRNPVPSSYLTGTHGAKAAYTLLQQSGYSIERWEEPLSQLAERAGPDTVVIFAQPFDAETTDQQAVAEILRKGGRVLSTGLEGSLLLPRSHAASSSQLSFAACEAQPEGLQPLSAPGNIWIVPSAIWKTPSTETDPDVRTAYACAKDPVVVEYPVDKGHAVWWASSTPLENGSIQRGADLELLLNSIGPPEDGHQPRHIYWDESLHGESHSSWDYVRGPVWPLLWSGAAGLMLLVVFSFSRRSGPIRALPQPPRTTPIEFLEALGALYRSTGAASTALHIAWERFRTQAAQLTGHRTTQMDARELALALERRFGSAAAHIEADLVAVEEACWEDKLKPSRALKLIRALRQHEETLRAASRHATTSQPRVTLGS